MVVTYVMVAVCIVGVLGGVASTLSYDKHYGEKGTGMRIPRHSRRSAQQTRRRSAQRPRPSRQLQALEAALTEDTATDQPPSCSPTRSRARRMAR